MLANHYKDNLLRAGCELQQIDREWSCVKSRVSLHLSGRSAEEAFASIFRSHADQCHDFLLLAEIVPIWPLSAAVVERGFSSMNRVGEDSFEVKHEPRELGWCSQDFSKVPSNPKSPKTPGICQLWSPLKDCQHVSHCKHSTSKRTVGRDSP